MRGKPPCYLCNLGGTEVPGDSSKHIFGACSSVFDAWEGVLYGANGPLDLPWAALAVNKVSPLFIPDYPPADPKAGYNRLALTMAVCWSVHRAIDQVKMGRSADGADARIVSLTISLINIWAPAKQNNH